MNDVNVVIARGEQFLWVYKSHSRNLAMCLCVNSASFAEVSQFLSCNQKKDARMPCRPNVDRSVLTHSIVYTRINVPLSSVKEFLLRLIMIGRQQVEHQFVENIIPRCCGYLDTDNEQRDNRRKISCLEDIVLRFCGYLPTPPFCILHNYTIIRAAKQL